jgi:hypothetical protein
MAFIYSKRESLDAYLPDTLKTETQIAAYYEAMPPNSIAGLKPAMDDGSFDDDVPGRACNPPMTRVPRGRPRKQRLDKANYRATRGVGAADLEGFTPQPPKPLNRPRQPYQNFLDFSKSLENSKNLPDYEEYSKYRGYRIISSKL